MGDGRDWTFVLDEVCSECGEDVRELDEGDLATLVRATGLRWQQLLTSRAADPAMRVRPTPTTWSPTEYAEHVRDVLALYTVRTRLMLSEDDPEFADWDPDTTADAVPYGQVAPGVAAVEITRNAERLAVIYDWVEPGGLARTGRRSDGATFTVGSLGRYMLHDLRHHLWDVDRRTTG
jgi:hypothetical protein